MNSYLYVLCKFIHAAKSNSVSSESASTSTGTVTVVMAPPGTPQQQQQQQQQLVEAQQQVVSQAETTDGSNSLSVTHVQAIQGHQLTIGNLNQVILKRIG